MWKVRQVKQLSSTNLSIRKFYARKIRKKFDDDLQKNNFEGVPYVGYYYKEFPFVNTRLTNSKNFLFRNIKVNLQCHVSGRIWTTQNLSNVHAWIFTALALASSSPTNFFVVYEEHILKKHKHKNNWKPKHVFNQYISSVLDYSTCAGLFSSCKEEDRRSSGNNADRL